MIETLTLRAFDEAVNPILVTELSGKILYKNPEAQLKMKKPAKGGNLFQYLTPDSQALTTGDAVKENFPAMLELTVEGELFSAFSDVVYYERRPVLLLVFSHLFEYELATPFFMMGPARLKETVSGEKLLNLFERIHTSAQMPKALKDRPYHHRMTTLYYRLTDRLLTELAYGIARVHFPLDYTVEILRYAADKVFSPLGLDFLFSLQSDNASSLLVDFKTFTLLVGNLLIFSAEVSDSHIIPVAAETQEEESVLLSLAMHLAGSHRSVPSGGMQSFSFLLPGRACDLLFFELLCRNQKYRFDFSLNQKEKENLRIRFQTPLYSPVAVHSRDLFGLEDAKRIIDSFLAEVSFNEKDDAKRCQ